MEEKQKSRRWWRWLPWLLIGVLLAYPLSAPIVVRSWHDHNWPHWVLWSYSPLSYVAYELLPEFVGESWYWYVNCLLPEDMEVLM